jgi:alkaline phosphatase D
MTRATRRTFILAGAAAAGASLLPARPARAAIGYPFLLGVASGDPTPAGVVLWTRLAQTPTSPDGYGGMPDIPIAVEWQVATDESFNQVVRSGSVLAVRGSAHTTHVEVAGLRPATPYFYRFRTGGFISPVGRTRTAPAPDTVGAPLTVLTASCAHYQAGYYTAYRRMAEEDPDLVVFLGDYIYEVGANAGVRQHLPSDEAATLAAYRVRHAQYKTDLDLQAAHAAAPWIPVWDDHEVENNYAKLTRADASPSGDFAVRRAAAYQAYYEHMPLRAAQAPVNERMRLYRRLQWGTLATFHMLDTRQYREPHTITGLEQVTWLLNGLGQHQATWDIIGQQVFFAQRFLGADGARSVDAWDGYVADRDRIQRGWDSRGVRGAVVLSGDVHAAYANNLMADYDLQDRVVGTELVTTSISSGGDGNATDTSGLSSLNPHIKYYSNLRGYLRTTVDATRIAVDYRALAKVTVPGYPIQTIKQYVIEAGNPGLQDP